MHIYFVKKNNITKYAGEGLSFKDFLQHSLLLNCYYSSENMHFDLQDAVSQSNYVFTQFISSLSIIT